MEKTEFKNLDWDEKKLVFRLDSLARLLEETSCDGQDEVLAGLSGILEDTSAQMKEYMLKVNTDGKRQ